MIDIHHHCLPGVDDGPRDWDEAVDLCALAFESGIETIVATPHVLRGRWRNTSRADLEARLLALRDRTNDQPHLLLGSEYFFAHDVVEVVSSGTQVVPLAGSRYVLIEFASTAVPPMVEQPFYRLQLEGWTPVIAHPERNTVFQSKPELLRKLIRLGAKTQVTTASFVGGFGADAERCAQEWLREEMIHVVATDAHNRDRRPPVVAEARQLIEEVVGAERAAALFVGNPRAITEGRGLEYEPELPDPSADASGLFGRFKKLFQIH